MNREHQSDHSHQDDFALYYIKNQGRVYAYIATLVPNRSDAEDLLQRTSLVMWQKWDRFDPRYGFLPWARGIALNEIRNYLRRSERRNVQLSEAVVSMLAEHSEQVADSDRSEALSVCLQSLEEKQRALLEGCYLESAGCKSTAESMGISVDAVYMRLHRIRRFLVHCIEGRVSDGLATQGVTEQITKQITKQGGLS
ncbi:sigma-70 family RNA polymerase sigma factor [Roseiconus lacunae]|uniref:Sigma-70 family RNA polymerase sigma factor n=1 Tax=Roseiconus lacunae TaxID=2605694 RepID=A0ABT7PS80_9BACT|nr:sigma-70 family RNA polymerase sigma factor [Roseiconus lacunae]MDM4019196.1 sigma-70 family RNA polymerase sigma factor [Roseiconus lacunae]WRQ48399.1 sigma-70 family RNA polymerase sigma factor [Stieleria sp. HD01]